MDGSALEDSPWSWVSDRGGPLNLAGCLTFSRGSDAATVISAFGMDPARARELSLTQAHQYFGTNTFADPGWLRVARTGDWIAAIEESHLAGTLDDVAKQLSAAGESVVVSYTEANATATVEYYADNTLVVAFDPNSPWHRRGSRPDLFLERMREAGLDADGNGDLDDDDQEPLIAALTMLTLALGIRLSRDTAAGPLLTVGAELP